MKSCMNCRYCKKFIQVDSQHRVIYICGGKSWDLNDDGSKDLMEVSEFDASDCLLFKDKLF